jgi:glycylpeptide N-tetradecanoyltransferase
MIRMNKLPSAPLLADRAYGLREMDESDIPAVTGLFMQYMQRFDMAPVMTMEEIRHQFLSGQGVGNKGKESWGTRRQGQVTWSYVVEASKVTLKGQLYKG